ncbi:MAG TPA: PAS domain S-box protein [Burkholderiales bacterium]|nr:PAS domain S-box protein [Burkholderiales bacterium]
MEVDAYLAEQIAAGADPEQFRLLVQSVTDYAIFLLDSNGRVSSWNEGAERIKGYGASEIVGRPIALFYPPEDRDAGKPEQGLDCAEREGRFHTEGWRLRKDGSRFWADVVITALRDARGGLRGFAKVTRDMSARHRERENEQRVAAMLERQRALAELGLLALGETGLEPVLERAVAMVRDLLQTEFVRVLELLPEGDALKLVAGTGWKPGMVGSATVPLRANSILSYTLYSSDLAPDTANQPRRAAVIEDLASEDRFPRTGMLHEHGIVSGMSIVIPGRGIPYGVLGAHSATRRRFMPGDAEFLQAVANVVSAAVQRQRAHEQVRASEARLVAFADHSQAVMFLKDREGRYRLVNEQFLQRFGLRRDQVIGRTDLELFPRDQALSFAANDAEVLSRGAPLQFEESARYIEGERVSLVAKFPVPDASGAVTGVGGVATDITERKRTEQALREQRTLLAEAQNLAGLGSWEWDAANGRVTWSDELYRIYGVERERFTPSYEGYLERVHPDDRQQTRSTLARALMDGRGFTFDERIVRPDGEVRYLRSRGELVRDDKGRSLKVLGTCLDITEQRNSETALRAAADNLQALTRRLVEAEEAERRRIARELHDRVGQNLSALNINLDLALGAAAGASPLRRRIEDSVSLVDATLQSIENVMAELRPPLLDEYGLGAALGWYAEEFSRRTGIAVVLRDGKDAAADLRPEAAVALFRIAQEALNNVAKHAGAKQVRVELACEAEEIVLRVADDGAGFDPAAAARGKRWGMKTMRERAEAAGGRLEVDSAPGEGTIVRASVRR